MSFYFNSLAAKEKQLKIYYKIRGQCAVKTRIKHDYLGSDAPTSILFEQPRTLITPVPLPEKGIEGFDLNNI